MTELKPQNQTRSVHNTPHLGAKQQRSLWSSQQQSKRKKPDFHEDPKASDGQPTAQRGQLCQVRGVTQAKEQRMSTNSSPHGVGQSLPGSSRKCTRQGRGNHKGPPAAVTLWATHQWTNTHGDSVLINSPGCIRRCAYQYPTQAQHTCQ